MNAGIFLGAVDIGGTKTSVALLNAELKILAQNMFFTGETSCKNLACMCKDIFGILCGQQGVEQEKVAALGIACPGPLDLKKGRVVHIPTLGWKDEPIKQYFEKIFPFPVFLQNDANAAALGEYTAGAGRGHGIVAYVTVSTGIGCGIVLDGNILNGSADSAGELGHMKIRRNGRKCGCGGYGCLEAYASGRSIGKIATKKIGRPLSAKEVFRLAGEGNVKAREIIVQAADALGFSLAALIQTLDPDVIVLGGSVIRDYEYMEPFLRAALNAYTQMFSRRKTKIVKSRFDGEQVLIGIAAFARRELGCAPRSPLR